MAIWTITVPVPAVGQEAVVPLPDSGLSLIVATKPLPRNRDGIPACARARQRLRVIDGRGRTYPCAAYSTLVSGRSGQSIGNLIHVEPLRPDETGPAPQDGEGQFLVWRQDQGTALVRVILRPWDDATDEGAWPPTDYVFSDWS